MVFDKKQNKQISISYCFFAKHSKYTFFKMQKTNQLIAHQICQDYGLVKIQDTL